MAPGRVLQCCEPQGHHEKQNKNVLKVFKVVRYMINCAFFYLLMEALYLLSSQATTTFINC